MSTSTKLRVGYMVCTYIHDGRRYRQHWFVQGADDGFFWARSPRFACIFESEDDAREVAYAHAKDGYWIATRLL